MKPRVWHLLGCVAWLGLAGLSFVGLVLIFKWALHLGGRV